jgi:hypothetical protein
VETAVCTTLPDPDPDPDPGFVDPFSLPESELDEAVDVDTGGDVEPCAPAVAEPDDDGV